VRGCLFILVLAAAVLSAAAWFGSPMLASSVISGALDNAGYHAASSTVTATSDPPLKLLLGRADRVEIAGTDVDFRTFHAASLDLVVTDVDVLGRTAGRMSGRIDGAEMITSAGETTTADVTIDGVASGADASIVVDAATIVRVVKGTFQQKFGVAVSSVKLIAPDTLRISAPGATVEGQVLVDPDGAIAFSTSLGSSPILSLDPSFPLRFRSVRVDGGNLRIDAILDAESLLGG
jgi:hypothetical protein